MKGMLKITVTPTVCFYGHQTSLVYTAVLYAILTGLHTVIYMFIPYSFSLPSQDAMQTSTSISFSLLALSREQVFGPQCGYFAVRLATFSNTVACSLRDLGQLSCFLDHLQCKQPKKYSLLTESDAFMATGESVVRFCHRLALYIPLHLVHQTCL